MTYFDPELIAALAEGRLPPAEAAALEREIGADPAAASELAAQRRALHAITALAPATLSDPERQRLRSSVAAELGLDTAPEPLSTRPRRTRRIPWPAVAVAAASLVAIVAVVPGLGLLSTDDGDSSATFVLADEAADTTDLRASQEGAPEPGDGGQVGAGVPDNGADTDAALESEAATTTAAAALPTDDETLRDLDPGLRRLLDEPSLLLEFETPPDPAPCAGEALQILGAATSADLGAVVVPLTDGAGSIVWFLSADGTIRSAAAFSPADCTLLGATGE
jgi:hypothetical protein